jgi:hypothetical protein
MYFDDEEEDYIDEDQDDEEFHDAVDDYVRSQSIF